VLELKDITYSITREQDELQLLKNISLQVPRGHFMAIVGPSGCGKTTLLKTLAGIYLQSSGDICWDGRNLEHDGDLEPNEVGYVPQFSIAYDQLSVDESIEACVKLRVDYDNIHDLDRRIDRVLEECGLTAIADRRVKVLSGGQKRRLALAMELVSDPHLLLCDEVTSGLDPRSEREIVQLLHQLSRREGRVVISVTHSLAHMELYDSILVLHEGNVAYHGSPQHVLSYFGVSTLEDIYPHLSRRSSEDWANSYEKRRSSYYEALEQQRQKLISTGQLVIPREFLPAEQQPRDGILAEKPEPTRLPGFLRQFCALFSRRMKILMRDRGQLVLQIAMIVLFPLLVSLFSSKGTDPIKKLSAARDINLVQEIQQQQSVQENTLKVGGAVSGIIMFQVILLGLMGSNNAAREIAGERLIFEKEKYGGVRNSAYLASKVAFLGMLVLVQSLWMFMFVQYFWPFRGDMLGHFGFLLLANASITAVCMAISSYAKTPDQGSLLSIYLVGFQLPLSGAILALPGFIEQLVRPFIAAYWAWSGSIGGLEISVRNAVEKAIDTSLSGIDTCCIVLLLHITLGIVISWFGVRRHQWD